MTSHDVTLEWPDGRTRTIAVREDETVLEAAERVDIALPFGCRTGACGTCTGRLLGADRPGPTNADGDDVERVPDEPGAGARESASVVEYRRPPRALKDRHRRNGYVLLCIALPRADCRVAVGSSVHGELVDNPWK